MLVLLEYLYLGSSMSLKTDLSGLPDNIILLFFENVLGKVSNVFFDTM